MQKQLILFALLVIGLNACSTTPPEVEVLEEPGETALEYSLSDLQIDTEFNSEEDTSAGEFNMLAYCSLLDENGDLIVELERQGFYQDCEVLRVVNDVAVIRWAPDGIGGYILFNALISIETYDLNTGDRSTLEEVCSMPISLSVVRPEIVFCDVEGDAGFDSVNLVDGSVVNHYETPDSIIQYGDIQEKGDASVAAYAGAASSPENERWFLLLAEADGSVDTLIADSELQISVTGWEGDAVLFTQGGIQCEIEPGKEAVCE